MPQSPPDLSVETGAVPAAASESVPARAPGRRAIFRIRRMPTAGLVVALLGLALILPWVAIIRPLNAPDEPAHLQAVMVIRKQHVLPEIHYAFESPKGRVLGSPGDADVQAYTQQLRRGTYVLIPYESMQAPLYYVTAALASEVIRSPDPQQLLYISRIVAALFGAGTVFFCWAATRELAPGAPMWALAVAGVVALLPQFGFNSATAANDSAFNCVAAAAFFVWFRGLRRPGFDRWMLGAGAMLGLAVLAKLTGAALAPALGLVLLFRAFQAVDSTWGARLRRGAQMALGATIGTLVVCGWWIVRNWLVYGEPTGSRDAFLFYHGRFQQLDLFDPVSRDTFLQQTWESFWGRFGWMSLRLPFTLYNLAMYLTILFVGLSLLAAVLRLRQVRRAHLALPAYSWQVAAVLAVATLGIVAGYLQYNIGVNIQAQGRYLFGLLLPGALVFTGGLYALAPGRRLKIVALSVPLVWLAYLDVVSLAAVAFTP